MISGEDPPDDEARTIPAGAPTDGESMPAWDDADTARALADDPDAAALSRYVQDAQAALHGRAWDNLLHVERFARALRFLVKGVAFDAPRGAPPTLAEPLAARYVDALSRRTLFERVAALLPPPLSALAPRPLPAQVLAAAPARAHSSSGAPLRFALRPGAVPRTAAVFTDPLAGGVDALWRAGAGPLLAPRSLCPGAGRGSAIAVVIDAVGGGVARVHVPAEVGPDGAPLGGALEAITVSVDVLRGWLCAAGPDARGLDLRGADDRALLLTWSALLRATQVAGRSAATWLCEATSDTPEPVRRSAVDAAVACAVRALTEHTADPLALRFVLAPYDGDCGWVEEALSWLDDTGAVRDVVGRRTASGTREVVWADALLKPGFVGGRLSPVAAGRAFARLATSVLAPLGVLPLSGLRDGSGAVVLQRLLTSHDDESPSSDATAPSAPSPSLAVAPPAVVRFAAAPPSLRGAAAADDARGLASLFAAWRHGDALSLPEPKSGPQHDLAQMPAWASFFFDSLDDHVEGGGR
jgi:hypothetical protein